MTIDNQTMYTPDQLRKAALQFKIIAGKNLAELFKLPDDAGSDNIVKFVDSIVHASVLEVSALVQQAGQMAADSEAIKNLQNNG